MDSSVLLDFTKIRLHVKEGFAPLERARTRPGPDMGPPAWWSNPEVEISGLLLLRQSFREMRIVRTLNKRLGRQNPPQKFQIARSRSHRSHERQRGL